MVPESSATLGGDYDVNIALHTDHRGLNKFGKRTENYLLVVETLMNVISSKNRTRKEIKIESACPVQEDVQLHKGTSLQQLWQSYLNSSLPPQILCNAPVVLFDARGRIFSFSPDFIGSFEVCKAIETRI